MPCLQTLGNRSLIIPKGIILRLRGAGIQALSVRTHDPDILHKIKRPGLAS